MKTILFFLTWFLFNANVVYSALDIHRACNNQDGTLTIASYSGESWKDRINESQDQYMDRVDIKSGRNPANCFNVDKSDIPFDKNDQWEQWRVKDQAGRKIVFVDPTAASPRKDAENKRNADRLSGKAHLRAGQPLTQDEVIALFD